MVNGHTPENIKSNYYKLFETNSSFQCKILDASFYSFFYENLYKIIHQMYEELKSRILNTLFYYVVFQNEYIDMYINNIDNALKENALKENALKENKNDENNYKPFYLVCAEIINLFIKIKELDIFNIKKKTDSKNKIIKYIENYNRITNNDTFDTHFKELKISSIIINQINNVSSDLLPLTTDNEPYIDYDTFNFFVNYDANDILNYTKYLEYIKYSCGLRRKEGIYINKELQTLRESIKIILTQKYPNYYNYNDDCFDQYKINNKKNNMNIYSILKNVFFKSIFEHIYDNNMNSDNVNKFINNIIICIFGIFNITGTENNPPAVPYINLLEYKNFIYSQKILGYMDFRNDYLNKILQKIKYYTNTKIYDGLIKKIEEYIRILDIIYEKTRKLIDNKPFYSEQDMSKFYKPKAILEDIVSSIDNLNSTSVIGTLEFIDRTMKLYNTNILCEGTVEEVKQEVKVVKEKEVKEEVKKEEVIPITNTQNNSKKQPRRPRNVKETEIGSSFTFINEKIIEEHNKFNNFKLQIIGSSKILEQLNIIDIITKDIVKKRQMFIDQIQDEYTKQIFLGQNIKIENQDIIINTGAQEGETLENVYIWDNNSIIGILIVSNKLYLKYNRQQSNYNIKYLYANTNETHKILIGLYFNCLKEYNNNNNTQKDGFITLYGNYCNYSDYNLYNQLGFKYNPNVFRQYIGNKTLLTHNLMMSVPIGNYAFNKTNKIIDNQPALKYQTIKYYLYEYYNLYKDPSNKTIWYSILYFLDDIEIFIKSEDIINDYYKSKDNKEPKIFEAIDNYIKDLEKPK
jgi:hypothetical protein